MSIQSWTLNRYFFKNPPFQVLHTECHTDDSATSFLALPGGLANGKDSQEMHDAAQFATKYINKKVNSMYLKGLYKINKVQQQVSLSQA